MGPTSRRRLALTALPLAIFLSLTLAGPGFGSAAQTTRVSVSSGGTQGDLGSVLAPSVSAGGRFVAFTSDATNLVPGDTNGAPDVFVHDRGTGETERVSVSSAGAEGDSASYFPSISAHGRFVAFASYATNLVPDDTNGSLDVFAHDLRTGETELASVSSAGAEGNSVSEDPSMSADGRSVAFASDATNLVPDDTNGAFDVFVRDRRTGQTERVSVSSIGVQANDASGGTLGQSISADGRFVGFVSDATNLVTDDTNGLDDIFVHDRRAETTERVSVSSAGAEGNSGSDDPSISAHGRLVAFASSASNLATGDTNGALDVFVRNRRTDGTERVSVSSSGRQGNSDSFVPSISALGRFVGFDSSARNLVPDDTNRAVDVFVRGPPR